MKIDNYLRKIEAADQEYDGFTELGRDQARFILAQYAVDCIHDSELAKEAHKIIRDNNDH